MKTRTGTQQFLHLFRLTGWSQATAARELGISPSAVSQICNGKTRPSGSVLALLQFRADELDRPAKPLAKQRFRHHWELNLVAALRELPDAQRKPLLRAFHETLRVIGAAR